MSYLENPPARVPLISQDTYAASGAGISGVSGGGGGVGVVSLNSLQGALNLTSSDSTVTITPAGTSINLQTSAAGGRVVSLNTLQGALDLTSSDNSVTITPGLSSINLQASGAGSIPSNLNLSTLGIGGTGSGGNPPLNLAVRGGTTVSEIIGFSRPGHTNIAQGILSIYGDDVNSENTLSVVYLSSGVTVNAPINVSNVYADGLVNTSSITGLSSINGQPYVPGGGVVSPNLALSTLVMNPTGGIGVSTITGLSSINGQPYVPGGGVVSPNLALSTLVMNPAGGIGVSSITGLSSITNTDLITIATPDELHFAAQGNVIITTPADFYANRVFISSIDLADAANGYITGVSSINGAAYPPAAGSVPANLTLSTLGVSSLVTAKTVVADLVSTGTLQAYSVTANYGVSVNLVNTQPGVAIDLYGFYNSLGSGSIPTVTWKNIGYNPDTGATLSTVGLGINGVSSMQMTPANMNITYPGLPASGLCIAGDTPGGTGQSVTSLITSGVVFADNLKDFSCPVIGIKNGDNVSSLTISCVSSITLEGIQLDMTNCNKLVGVTSINGVPWSAISSLIPP